MGFPCCKNRQKQKDGFGGKSIGWLGGYSILISNMTGPAMVTIPLVYQSSGFLLPTMAFIGIGFLTYIASSLLCEAMACIPGNDKFQGRIEFSTLARFFLGKRGHIFAQIFINVSLQCLNIASIIISAQVMDDCIIAIFKQSCGVRLSPDPGWVCASVIADQASPFDGSVMLITAGYLVTLAFTIPMGLLNLDDNVYIQVFALFFLIAVMTNWVVSFFRAGLEFDKVPVVGGHLSEIIGNVIFNYGFITTVPSWVNEKKPSVGVSSTLGASILTSCCLFIGIGWLGSMAFYFPHASNLLSVVVSSPESTLLDHILLYLFPPVVLCLSIPVFSIVVRYNLLQNKVCGRKMSNFFAVILPWLLVIPFMTGQGLMIVINWSSLFFTSVSNFILPYFLFIYAIKFRRDIASGRVELTEAQEDILHEMKMDASQVRDDFSLSMKRLPTTINVTVDDEEQTAGLLNFSNRDPEDADTEEETGYKAFAGICSHPKILAYVSAGILFALVMINVSSDVYKLIFLGQSDPSA